MKKKDVTKKIEERQPGEPAWLYDDPDQGRLNIPRKIMLSLQMDLFEAIAMFWL